MTDTTEDQEARAEALQGKELERAKGGFFAFNPTFQGGVRAPVTGETSRGDGVVLGQDGSDLLIVNNGDGSDFMD